MAGGATQERMNLTAANERRAGGAVTAHAVGRDRGRGGIDGHRGRMVVAVTVEVAAMTLAAGAAFAAVDRGVAMAVDPHPAVAVGRVMAGGARGMDTGNDIAGMTVHAQGGSRHRGAMVVAVAAKVSGMTLGAGGAAEDGGNLRPVERVLQVWW